MNIGRAFLAVFLFAAPAVALASPESRGPDPEAIVKNLYKAHDAHKGPFSQTENRGLIDRYFTKELAALIWKDAVTANGEIGALDFDPLHNSQDPQITAFKIAKVKLRENTKDEAPAALDVTFKDSGKPVTIGFHFEQDPNKAWKIADIHYADGRSLRAILRGH
jgi:hypothetical protein